MIRRLADRIAEFFFPRRCLLCGRIAADAESVCKDCVRDAARNHAYMLPPDPRRRDLYCCTAALIYTGPVRAGILGLKFRERKGAAAVLAKYMADVRYVNSMERCDFVTAVPLSRRRLASRGFNQSELIGRAYEDYTGKIYLDGVLKKTKENQTQSSLGDAKRRVENVKDCYAVCDPEMVRGKRILLVDDVYTTGATIRECARVLRRAGAEMVCGLTAATAHGQNAKIYKK